MADAQYATRTTFVTVGCSTQHSATNLAGHTMQSVPRTTLCKRLLFAATFFRPENFWTNGFEDRSGARFHFCVTRQMKNCKWFGATFCEHLVCGTVLRISNLRSTLSFCGNWFAIYFYSGITWLVTVPIHFMVGCREIGSSIWLVYVCACARCITSEIRPSAQGLRSWAFHSRVTGLSCLDLEANPWHMPDWTGIA